MRVEIVDGQYVLMSRDWAGQIPESDVDVAGLRLETHQDVTYVSVMDPEETEFVDLNVDLLPGAPYETTGWDEAWTERREADVRFTGASCVASTELVEQGQFHPEPGDLHLLLYARRTSPVDQAEGAATEEHQVFIWPLLG